MLTLSQLTTSNGGDEEGRGGGGEILLEDINFDDIFVGFDDDGDILPDLEIDPSDIFADFSFSSGEDSGNTAGLGGDTVDKGLLAENYKREEDKELSQGEVEVVSARAKHDSGATQKSSIATSEGCNKGRRTTATTASAAAASKGSQGKKKAKVDWTPELHRRFVQAVEQLGVDKAVPSRILELMGIDCLTRHNIASHLQKYRSHRKHLLAREAEAASSWSHRSRQMMYTAAGVSGGGANSNNSNKMSMSTNWAGAAPPTIIGFPPPHPPHLMHQQQHFRPLHVWGHPTAVEHPQIVPMWSRPPWPVPPVRPPHALPPDPSYWHHHHHHHHPHFQRPLTQGTLYYAPQLLHAAMQRYPAPPVQGIPPHPVFRPPSQLAAAAVAPPPTKQSSSQTQLDAAQPSKERIDAAIGDVLAKPWLPLPLGLKPPSLESVMVELQKQGVPQVPPTCG